MDSLRFDDLPIEAPPKRKGHRGRLVLKKDEKPKPPTCVLEKVEDTTASNTFKLQPPDIDGGPIITFAPDKPEKGEEQTGVIRDKEGKKDPKIFMICRKDKEQKDVGGKIQLIWGGPGSQDDSPLEFTITAEQQKKILDWLKTAFKEAWDKGHAAQ